MYHTLLLVIGLVVAAHAHGQYVGAKRQRRSMHGVTKE
jgi:hypothetical protein